MASIGEFDARGVYTPSPATLTYRFLAWCVIAALFVFLLNVYLSFWHGWPGALAVVGDGSGALAWIQALTWAAVVGGPAVFVARTRRRSLRQDNEAMTAIATYIVNAAFWIVLLVGVVDAAISFLRVEGLLPGLFGDEMATELGRNHFRAPYIHGPLIVVALILAATVRKVGFAWLALLVVVAELQIVISRFIFSYEQAFMGDMVRMWYAGLFLFASAYTLIEEGHVRVDVLYSGFTQRTKGLVNAVGSVVLGLPFCWTIILLGMSKPTSIITNPLLSLEVTQSGFGMYIKYLMAAFLAVFAVSMAVQFTGYFLEGVADYRGEAGKRKLDSEAVAPGG
ncbi:MAG: TRAP transporter small permease subunit [Gammaproteobacteria bacterium]|nr:TRAP transporter small permease subunit [Gammaproteobacteria bacterium]